MINKPSDKLSFLAVLFYIPFSIFFICWLYLVQFIYVPDTWQYDTFYGENGAMALIWLFIDLLPAVLFLVFKSRGKKFISRLSGAIGFFCLLGGLISALHYLAYPGFVFLVISVVARRMGEAG